MTTWMVGVQSEYEDHWDIAQREGFWDSSTFNRQTPMQIGERAYFRTTSAQGRLLGSVILTSQQFPIPDEATLPWRSDDRTYRARFTFEVESATPLVPTPRHILTENVPLLGGQQATIRAVATPAAEDWLLSRVLDIPRGYSFEDAKAADEAARRAAGIDPDHDTRRTVLAARMLREGQPAFRRALLAAYEETCAVTGLAFPQLLEAAHINPYRGPETHQVDNGILLRADIHTLLDLDLLTICVEGDDYVVRCAPELADTEYGRLNGVHVSAPAAGHPRPRPEYLARHNGRCRSWLDARTHPAGGS